MNLNSFVLKYLLVPFCAGLGIGAQTKTSASGSQPDSTDSRPASVVRPEERAKIQQAIPVQAFAAPTKPRRLLIFDRNVGYPGHRSIDYASEAFVMMGKRTGAFDTVVSRDPQVFESGSLRQFDAVFLNNTVGNLFEDAKLRRNLIDFVYGGGGLMGVHGTTVAFTRWPGALEDWPEFGVMIGARGASHRDSDEHVYIKLDDPTHPVNQPFGGEGFDFRDEFFRVHEPYSRDRVRVLLSFDTEKTDLDQGTHRGGAVREDNDYAVAWIRSYGRGRVFYCTIAHNPYVFWDRRMLSFYLAATQFALGDLHGPTTPSSRLTPATRAQEKLGWRLEGISDLAKPGTLYDTIDVAAETSLTNVGGASDHEVSPDIPKHLDYQLSHDERRQVRLKLDSAGARLLTYRVSSLPSDRAGCRKVFEFARNMGVEAIIANPTLGMLGVLERLCDEYNLKLAICSDGATATAGNWSPKRIKESCKGRSQRLGACADLDHWDQTGVDAVDAVTMLGDRLMIVRTKRGGDAARNIRSKQDEQLLKTLHQLQIKPIAFAIQHARSRTDAVNDVAPTLESYNRVMLSFGE